MRSNFGSFLDGLSRRDIKRAIQVSIFGGALVIIGGFTLIKANDLLFGTKLIINSPADGATVIDNHIRIVGSAPNSSSIYINDGKILPDQAGNFIEQYILAPGLNIFEISSQDRFGRNQSRLISVVYQEVNDPEEGVEIEKPITPDANESDKEAADVPLGSSTQLN